MSHLRSSVAIFLFTALVLVCLSIAASGRPGGGQTHSSGGSRSSSSGSSRSSGGSVGGSTSSAGTSSGSSSSGGGTVGGGTVGGSAGGCGIIAGFAFLVVVVFVIVVVVVVVKAKGGAAATPAPVQPDLGANLPAELQALKRADPNFSVVLFIDFVNTLYARAQEARGRGTVDMLSPYLAEQAQGQLLSLGSTATGLTEVLGVVLGASKIVNVSSNPEGTVVMVWFEANYTERGQSGETSFYTEERWHFWRQAGVLSLPPGKIDAIHCPKCGGPLERTGDGACPYCNTVVKGGEFHWFVTGIELLARETRGPQLTAETAEEGNDLPTVFAPDFEQARVAFEASNPDFSWQRMNERASHIFFRISEAWTNLQWEKARPYETDNIFQMHRYWMDAYRRQQLRNVLDQINILKIEWVKIDQDAYYDSVTARIWARELDYTVDNSGRLIIGSPTKPREFSEYWTFIKTRGGKAIQQRDDNCPNCGAPLQINMAGTCEFCGGKVTSGDFDWVLSRIEQDESYSA